MSEDPTSLAVLAYVGVPLAGKHTSLRALARTLQASVLDFRCVGSDREVILSATVPTGRGGRVRAQAMVGAVWSAATWKLQAATADALVILVDPQRDRDDWQHRFLHELAAAMHAARPDAAQLPVAVQVNKADLRPADAAAYRLPDLGFNVVSCSLSVAAHAKRQGGT